MINFSIFGFSSIGTLYFLYKRDRPIYQHDIIDIGNEDLL